MTTHTDRKSGFGSFPAKGVQPLPTEPVQIYEDPGAAYWKEATKMAEHTDRIRQMAQEAGFRLEDGGWLLAGPATRPEPEMPALLRFAHLVAEDCARVAGALLEGCHKRNEYDEYSPSDAQTIGWIDGVDESQKRIRARYSLKD